MRNNDKRNSFQSTTLNKDKRKCAKAVDVEETSSLNELLKVNDMV